MPCFDPRPAWLMPNGRLSLKASNGMGRGEYMRVPCRQCIGCRTDNATDWAVRITHERSLHDEACFVTLTYKEEYLPPGGSLSTADARDFLKRLRIRLARDHSDKRVRFFLVGEYGESTARPHYHMVLFGHEFREDRKPWRKSKGFQLWRSPTLEETWGMGNCEFGHVSPQSAMYTAKYCTKKIVGKAAKEHYNGRTPEFLRCSKGLGKGWLEKFQSDVYPGDFTLLNGCKKRVPRYYDKQLDPDTLEAIKAARIARAELHADNNTFDRLKVREEVARAKAAIFSKRDSV